MADLPIEAMLVLSTGYLTYDTCNRYFARGVYGPAWEKGEYGWFVYVREDNHDVPEDLARCLDFAREHKLCWIMFDRDAVGVAELPTYDW